MGKNTPQPLFIPLLGCFFFSNRWARISTNTARIITRLRIGNLGQLRSGSDFFFFYQNPVETLFIVFGCIFFFFYITQHAKYGWQEQTGTKLPRKEPECNYVLTMQYRKIKSQVRLVYCVVFLCLSR